MCWNKNDARQYLKIFKRIPRARGQAGAITKLDKLEFMTCFVNLDIDGALNKRSAVCKLRCFCKIEHWCLVIINTFRLIISTDVEDGYWQKNWRLTNVTAAKNTVSNSPIDKNLWIFHLHKKRWLSASWIVFQECWCWLLAAGAGQHSRASTSGAGLVQ